MKFDLNALYISYLSDKKMNEEEMHPIKRKEMRQAFYSGAGTMLTVLLSKDYPEENAWDILYSLQDQIKNTLEQ